MRSQTIKIVLAVIITALVVGGAIYFLSNKSGSVKEVGMPNQPATGAPAANTAPANPSLSEQPDQAKYNEYFSDISLGKMAIGKKIGTDGFPTNTNIFTSGVDQFCTSMMLKKTIISGRFASAVYDIVAKKVDSPKTVFPMELKEGGNGGCSSLTQSAGKYEYKIYVDDVLAAVLPFEVI